MNNSCDLLDHESFLIFGAARSGLAAARLLASMGKRVAIYDEAPPERLAEARREADAIGVALLSDLSEIGFPNGWQVLVLSPGIPPAHPLALTAEQCGCVVRSEIEIGFLASPAPIAAITGTNGKTTVTHLVTHMLQSAGRPAAMGGNVGRPLTDAILDAQASQPGAVIVCEVSSYQLETIACFAPRVACVLNVTPDHLQRYGSMDNYVAAKSRVTENQRPDDVLVLNGDDAYCRSIEMKSRAEVRRFSVRHSVARGAYLDGETLYLADETRGAPVAALRRDDIALPGLHNVENVLAALAIGAALGLAPAQMAEAVRSFRAVAHRIEFIAEIDGVRYYNDSKATNLDSTGKALESFAPESGGSPRRIVLIAGGRDKGSPWTALSDLVAQKVKGLVLIGEATPIGRKAWGPIVPAVREAASMAEALDAARAMAAAGDVVLLSPGCASFDWYPNFEARGDDFRASVLALDGGAAEARS